MTLRNETDFDPAVEGALADLFDIAGFGLPVVSAGLAGRVTQRLDLLGDPARLQPPGLDTLGADLIAQMVNVLTEWLRSFLEPTDSDGE
jgi:hypothetical protein